jgi:transcription-repair coupling factor (superfamily II helicase)
VFPPTNEHPLRIEFWGDNVEEIRSFAVADQRSLANVDEGLWAPAVRELLLTDHVRARAAQLSSIPQLTEMCDKLANGITVEGMESLSPVLADGMTSLLELLAPGTQVVLMQPERIDARAHDLVRTAEEFLAASWHNAAAGNDTPIDLAGLNYLSIDDLQIAAIQRSMRWWDLSALPSDDELAQDTELRITVDASECNGYKGDYVGMGMMDVAAQVLVEVAAG